MPRSSLEARLKKPFVRASMRLPWSLGERLCGPPPVNARAVALDRDAHWICFLNETVGKPLAGRAPERARADLVDSIYAVEGRPVEVSTRDLTVGGRPCRLYQPAADLRLMVYLHGGGHEGCCI